MAQTLSTMMPLGTKAPDFALVDTISGKTLALKDVASSVATVVMFICNHCPYVIHIRPQLVQLAQKYKNQGISFVAISSNDVQSYPADSPENMKLVAQEFSFPFPYLYDETQEVARAYAAACTPDFYIFDKDLSCVYRGQMDDSRPSSAHPPTGKDLCLALDQIIENRPITLEQKPSMGCNIKWKKI